MPRNPYYAGPITDHFDGTRFFNPQGQGPTGLRDALRWQFGGTRQKWPKRLPTPATVRPEPAVDDLTITMVGHATLLIQTAGLNLLTDPDLVTARLTGPTGRSAPRSSTPESALTICRASMRCCSATTTTTTSTSPPSNASRPRMTRWSSRLLATTPSCAPPACVA
ncbi:hypothetical protein OKA06_19535 [Novosphingobium sp. MW5]|nr:hypothetical protein [Novosphingobium sp. MW5]